MKWFSFEDLMPQQDMNILVLSYRDEVAIVTWDNKLIDDYDGWTFFYDTGQISRPFDKARFWMPVSYLDLPKADKRDDDKLAPKSNMLHGLSQEQEKVVQRIKEQQQAYDKLSEKELQEHIKLPDGSGVRKYHLTRQVAKLYSELLYGPQWNR